MHPNPSLSLSPLALVLLHYHSLRLGYRRSACFASARLRPKLRLSKMGGGGGGRELRYELDERLNAN